MSIALRFIPTILDEFERIALAQRARGANIGEGGLLKRAKAFVPLLIPLFVSAFRRAEELADAMESRCYRGGEGRSKWREKPWRLRDTLTLSFFVLLLAAVIVYRAC
jgi:energy-coupling factor transport system permease protein